MIRSLPPHAALALVTLLVCAPAAAQDVQQETAITSGGFTYRLGLGYMFQASARRDYPFQDEAFRDDETFAWWRLRPRLAVSSDRVDIVVEGQDTHSAGGSFAARTAWLDLLNAYVDVKDMRGWSVRVGRQQGDLEVIGRLVRQADFAAVLRSFDVAAVSWQDRRTDIRGVVFRPLENLPDRFNRPRRGEWLWSAYARRQVNARTAIQSYVVTRHNAEVVGERGDLGTAAVYAWQVQLEAPTPATHVNWAVETVLQRGHHASDDVRGWGVFLRGDIQLPRNSTMEARYSVTSGDGERHDGVRGQFDPFYGAASYFGSLGQVRGTNVRAFSVGGAVPLRRRLTVNWRYFATRLHDRRDAWYGAVIPNRTRPDATAARLGQETALLLSYQARPQMLVRAGYFRFFPGGFIPSPGGAPHEFRLQIIGTL